MSWPRPSGTQPRWGLGLSETRQRRVAFWSASFVEGERWSWRFAFCDRVESHSEDKKYNEEEKYSFIVINSEFFYSLILTRMRPAGCMGAQ